jgi:hypothetical protein
LFGWGRAVYKGEGWVVGFAAVSKTLEQVGFCHVF